MATLADTYSWAADEAAIRAFLGIPTGLDTELELWFDAAIDAGDDMMLWEDADGNDIAHSPDVRLGIYEFIRHARKAHVAGGHVAGLEEKETGELREKYAGVGGSSGNPALAGALQYWKRHRKNPLLGGP